MLSLACYRYSPKRTLKSGLVFLMSKRFKIALTTRIESQWYDSGAEWRDALSHDWYPYLQNQGLDFCVVPNIGPDAVHCLDDVDGLVLTGGNSSWELGLSQPGYLNTRDLSEESMAWKESPETRRDITEFALLRIATERRLPVFGVCRGMQQLHRFFGGSLSRLLPSESHVATEHAIVFQGRGAYLPHVDQDIVVNSFHQNGIDTPIDCFKILARSVDNVIEAFEHRTHKMVGIMWHPERVNSQAAAIEYNRTLMRRFLEKE